MSIFLNILPPPLEIIRRHHGLKKWFDLAFAVSEVFGELVDVVCFGLGVERASDEAFVDFLNGAFIKLSRRHQDFGKA